MDLAWVSLSITSTLASAVLPAQPGKFSGSWTITVARIGSRSPTRLFESPVKSVCTASPPRTGKVSGPPS